MTDKPKSRSRRARPGFVRKQWRERVSPAFLGYWTAVKKERAAPQIQDIKQRKREQQRCWAELMSAHRALDEASGKLETSAYLRVRAAILQRLDIEGPHIVPPLLPGQEGTFPQNPESSAVFRKIVFLKHGITFRELIRQVDIDKTPAAQGKLMAAHKDYWRIKTGSRFEELKLKFSWDHFGLIAQGLEFGVEKLNPDELAECLDEICPCQQKHSPEYLKKLRTSVRQACSRILAADIGTGDNW